MITLEKLNGMMTRGDAAMGGYDPELLFQIASQGKTYVEIGTKFGGSAIVAGLAGCEVHCIDHWEYPDRDPQTAPTPEYVLENWISAGLDPKKLRLYIHRHPPWPKALEHRMFDIGLIDGSHQEDACRKDWEEMRLHVTKYILFHDFNPQHPGVYKAFLEAAEDSEWQPIAHQYGILMR